MLTIPRKITLHWTAGQYLPNREEKEAYHLLIPKDAGVLKTHDFTAPLEHCWHDNTGNIGIAVCAMWKAGSGDFGAYPFTDSQLQTMLEAAALIAVLKKLTVSAVATHAERAVEKGYFGERWDFAVLKPASRLTPQMAIQTGEGLRKEIARKIERIEKIGIKAHPLYPELTKNCKEE